SFHLPEQGILFSGDTLFAGSIGRTDLPGGDYDQIIKSIKDRLMVLDDGTTVIPGHGEFTRIFDEKRTNPFL
ncbi:MAG TPA: MBL fold metallo-hydrolase, partial [Leptospiraceae bacterium]|nr:MBL fold metallo-hydrolase [Leptospiraceae bacterium]